MNGVGVLFSHEWSVFSYFLLNDRFIHSKNRESLGFSLAVNHLADRSEDEMRMMRGRQRSTGYNGALPFDRSQYDEKDVPGHIDWRLRGQLFTGHPVWSFAHWSSLGVICF